MSRADHKLYYRFEGITIQNEDLNNDLFNEFISSEKVPLKKLFIESYLSDKESEGAALDKYNGHESKRVKLVNIDSLINEKSIEFYNLRSKGVIDQSFYNAPTFLDQ